MRVVEGSKCLSAVLSILHKFALIALGFCFVVLMF